MRIALVGICQVHGIGDALVHLLDDAEIVAIEAPIFRNQNRLADAELLLDGCSAVFSHFLPDDYGSLSTSALQQRFKNLQLLPSMAFTGFHPDCIYIQSQQTILLSPVGSYHSAIAAAAFSQGMTRDRALGLFNAFVYRKLGYFLEFDKALLFLQKHTQAAGWDIEQELSTWLSSGPFMHTINHPKINVLASIGKLIAIKSGWIAQGTATPNLDYDMLENNTIWPTYPELARAVGITGSYVFKRAGGPRILEGRSALVRLPEFIAESYALYAGYPREAFDIPAVARVRDIIAAYA